MENKALWKELLHLGETHQIEFYWIRRHGGNEGHELVDQQAVRAR